MHRLSRRRLFGIVMASSVGVALAARLPSDRVDAASPPAGWIVLTRARDIVMTRPDGSDSRTLLSVGQGQFVFDVALSPDGTQLAYAYYTTPPGRGAGGSDIMVVTIQL